MELRPCPFCGYEAEKPYTRHERGAYIRQGVIKCSCGVEMRIHVISEQTVNRWSKGIGYRPKANCAIYEGDVNDVDAVIQFTKDELAKRWNYRSYDA